MDKDIYILETISPKSQWKPFEKWIVNKPLIRISSDVIGTNTYVFVNPEDNSALRQLLDDDFECVVTFCSPFLERDIKPHKKPIILNKDKRFILLN